MRFGNYNEINKKIEKTISEMFCNTNIEELTPYEKRKMIFENLCNNLSYDANLLDKIKFNNMRTCNRKYPRDPYSEFETVMDNQIGVCNGISQYYKLLLEKVGIFSYCVNCIIFYKGEPLGHQLNLVYDPINQTFSFDDVTCGVLTKEKGLSLSYLNFDLEEANKKEEKYGTKTLIGISTWQILSEEYLNFLFGRESNNLKTEYFNNMQEEKIVISNNEDFNKYGIVLSKQNNKNKVI